MSDGRFHRFCNLAEIKPTTKQNNEAKRQESMAKHIMEPKDKKGISQNKMKPMDKKATPNI